MATKKIPIFLAVSHLKTCGIDFTKDYHASVSFSQASELHEMARRVGYKKPKNANGSLGLYFFNYLNRKHSKFTQANL